jgi:hypothetical protein
MKRKNNAFRYSLWSVVAFFFAAIIPALNLFAQDSADSSAVKDSTTAVVIPPGNSTELIIILAVIAFLILALFLMRSAMRRGNPNP